VKYKSCYFPQSIQLVSVYILIVPSLVCTYSVEISELKCLKHAFFRHYDDNFRIRNVEADCLSCLLPYKIKILVIQENTFCNEKLIFFDTSLESYMHLEFKVLTAVNIKKSSAFWDIMQCCQLKVS
jgi:hypothetical protein